MALLLLVFALLMQGAQAQQPEVRLPEVAWTAPAPFDPADLAGAAEVIVRLEVDVGPDGVVIDARAVDAPNEPLRQAAESALRNTRFTPATADGEPVAVSITYALRFAVDVLPRRSVDGLVRKAGERTPMTDVPLELSGPDGAVAYATSDAEGRFTAWDLAPGTWTVAPAGPGLRSAPATAEVGEDRVVEVTLYVAEDRPWESVTGVDVYEVIGQRQAAEVTERRLDTAQAMSLPGTNGDILKAVLNFPGVARPPLGIGQLVIRGTEASSTRYYVDGVRIPQVFHFGGLSTVLNGDGLSEIRFLTGNYSVRYGDGLGGVVDLITARSIPKRSRGYLSIDVYQAALFVEQKIGPRTVLTLSGRRSYADAVLGPVLGAFGGGGSFRAPRYWDAQARVLHELPGGATVDALVLFSDDQFRLLQPDGESVAFGLSNTFLTGSLGFRSPLPGGWQTETRLIVGPERQSFQADDQTAYDEAIAVGLRQEFHRPVTEARPFGWRGGLDLRAAAQRFRLGLAGTPVDEGDSWRIRPALYVEGTVRAGPLDLINGLRATALTLPGTTSAWSFDPRMALELRATDTTTLIGTVGRFSEDPETRELLPESRGLASLSAPWSLQTSLGLRQRLPGSLTLEATGFLSEQRNLIVGREDRFDFGAGPPTPVPEDVGPYSNSGRGRAYGLELLMRLQQRRAGAWLSATLSRAERRPRADDAWTPFGFDQTIVINALGTWQLPRRWTVGARIRFGTGNPYFPVVNRAYSLQDRFFVPIFASSPSRLRAFWALDLRIDKQWTFRKWALTLYLDVQGITDPGNVELPGYSYDYSRSEPVGSTPALPAFGLKGAW